MAEALLRPCLLTRVNQQAPWWLGQWKLHKSGRGRAFFVGLLNRLKSFHPQLPIHCLAKNFLQSPAARDPPHAARSRAVSPQQSFAILGCCINLHALEPFGMIGCCRVPEASEYRNLGFDSHTRTRLAWLQAISPLNWLPAHQGTNLQNNTNKTHQI